MIFFKILKVHFNPHLLSRSDVWTIYCNIQLLLKGSQKPANWLKQCSGSNNCEKKISEMDLGGAHMVCFEHSLLHDWSKGKMKCGSTFKPLTWRTWPTKKNECTPSETLIIVKTSTGFLLQFWDSYRMLKNFSRVLNKALKLMFQNAYRIEVICWVE